MSWKAPGRTGAILYALAAALLSGIVAVVSRLRLAKRRGRKRAAEDLQGAVGGLVVARSETGQCGVEEFVDGLQDVFVADRSPGDHVRYHENFNALPREDFDNMASNNFDRQYQSNTLQLNLGEGRFAEVAQLAGTAQTDISWAPLIFDMDLDGWKDIFITNM